jgi:hypothetical protein
MPVFKPGQDEKRLALFTELITVTKLNRPALQQVMADFNAQMLGMLYSGQQAGLAGDDQVPADRSKRDLTYADRTGAHPQSTDADGPERERNRAKGGF